MSGIERYLDIMYLSHPVSRRHGRMGMLERAAQFAPFAALSGYGDTVDGAASAHLALFEGEGALNPAGMIR